MFFVFGEFLEFLPNYQNQQTTKMRQHNQLDHLLQLHTPGFVFQLFRLLSFPTCNFLEVGVIGVAGG